MLRYIKRLVPGRGGDCNLIIGSDKTALVDTGMAFCGDQLVTMLEEELAGRPLDYALLTHSHYDHVGGVMALRQRWPQLTVVGSQHAKGIFQREGALGMIRDLSEMAGKLYLGADYQLPHYSDDDLRVDLVVDDDDIINLGHQSVRVLVTPGHTNCSLSFFLESDRSCLTAEERLHSGDSVLFPCESVGCYMGEGRIESPFLIGFQKTLSSIEKCRRCKPYYIVSPHYGPVTDIAPEEYFNLAEREAYTVRDFILERHALGMDFDQILECCVDRFWTSRGIVREEQPLTAFTINMKATIAVVRRECL